MKTSIISILFLFNTTIVLSQQKVPDWFQKNMEQSIGIWITNNTNYKSKNEPFDQYGMDWEWGIGKQSIKGTLYGLINGKKQGVFWEFRQYWDFENNHGIVVQYGSDGTIGIGPMTQKNDIETKLIQEFIPPTGEKNTHGHLSTLNDSELTTTSYDIDTNGNWKKRRSYTWHLVASDEQKLGTFSISLAVKNIKASKDFYESIGFKIVDGNLDQNWVILKNGTSKIGLFQGMFTKNTMTFNPKSVREIHKKATEYKIPVLSVNGMDEKEGIASFMITDPDGNPILFDQH
ncbi:VOC family protein [Aquimarina sp. MMG016]|uniref:VOC family protein n=1 Tax=Aquimarina sp. MMG016 TaxID=2822690 RepID=UPI0032B3502B